MADTTPPNSGSEFSSRLTRRLAREAEVLFLGDELSNEALDQQFQELSETAQSALAGNTQLGEDLLRLTTLINPGDKSVGIDGTFQLTVSDDKMQLLLSISPPIGQGRDVVATDILNELRSRNITRGIIMKDIEQAVMDAEQGCAVRSRTIVRGSPPIAGVDPWVAYFGRQSGGVLEEVSAASLRPGSDEPVLCEQGDTIAYIRQGDPGRAGYTATGEELPPPPSAKAMNLHAGRNVTVTGGCYLSESEGTVLMQDGVLSVQQALVFYRDIDTHDSPLTFDGAIYIHGGVKSDVVIEATEDIFIDRVVEGANITSTGGNVVLRAGIAGRNKGRITAANDVDCGFAENATVRAGRDILLHVGALNSQLTAHHDILAETGKGGIAGGVLLAGHCIFAKRLGSCGTQTDVLTGISPEAIPALEQINQKAIKLQDRLQETAALVAQFDRAVRDPRSLSPRELQLYTNLLKLRLVTEHALNDLQERRHNILCETNTKTETSVKIHQKLESNVQFHIGPLNYKHRAAKGPLVFVYEPGYQHIVCKNR